MTFDFEPAKKVINKHLADLEFADDAAKQSYIKSFDSAVALFKSLNAIAPEDYRHAARIAVDMSMTLIQIALAGLAAFVVFTQTSGYPAFLSPRFFLLVFTGLFFFVSIMLGAIVVSGIWKRGEGREDSTPSPRWSTTRAGGPIGWQALLGVAAVILFGYLVLSRPGSQTAKGFALGLPGGDRFITSGEIIISGQWQNLCIVSKDTQDKAQLPPTKSGQTDSIAVSPR